MSLADPAKDRQLRAQRAKGGVGSLFAALVAAILCVGTGYQPALAIVFSLTILVLSLAVRQRLRRHSQRAQKLLVTANRGQAK